MRCRWGTGIRSGDNTTWLRHDLGNAGTGPASQRCRQYPPPRAVCASSAPSQPRGHRRESLAPAGGNLRRRLRLLLLPLVARIAIAVLVAVVIRVVAAGRNAQLVDHSADDPRAYTI